MGLIAGLGLRTGAFASSFHPVSMGSTSITLGIGVIGVDDRDMAVAVNRVAELQGGFVAARDGEIVAELPLPLLGYLTSLAAEAVVEQFTAVREAIAGFGCTLPGLYTQLGYLLLPVAPGLRISADGLVHIDEQFTHRSVPLIVT